MKNNEEFWMPRRWVAPSVRNPHSSRHIEKPVRDFLYRYECREALKPTEVGDEE